MRMSYKNRVPERFSRRSRSRSPRVSSSHYDNKSAYHTSKPPYEGNRRQDTFRSFNEGEYKKPNAYQSSNERYRKPDVSRSSNEKYKKADTSQSSNERYRKSDASQSSNERYKKPDTSRSSTEKYRKPEISRLSNEKRKDSHSLSTNKCKESFDRHDSHEKTSDKQTYEDKDEKHKLESSETKSKEKVRTSVRFSYLESKCSSPFIPMSRSKLMAEAKDISIVIERNLPSNVKPSLSDPIVHFDCEKHKFSIPRDPTEGRKPIFDREEVLKFRHDDPTRPEHGYSEKRRVVCSGSGIPEPEIRRQNRPISEYEERMHLHTSAEKKRARSPEREEEYRPREGFQRGRGGFRTRGYNRDFGRMRGRFSERDRGGDFNKDRSGFGGERRFDKDRRSDLGGERRFQNRDFDIKDRQRGGGIPRGDLRFRLERNAQEFSRRSDKPNVPQGDPVSIPKGTRYYLHDDRLDDNDVRGSFRYPPRRTFVPRGRGRGQLIKRLGFRNRALPPYNRERRPLNPRPRKWDHDKFSELEEPTSSTDNANTVTKATESSDTKPDEAETKSSEQMTVLDSA